MGVPQIGLCSVVNKIIFICFYWNRTSIERCISLLNMVLEDKVYSSVTEISLFCEARINMYCLTFVPESKKGSNFANGVLVFGNEMTGRVQRPWNPKPYKEGGDRATDRKSKQERKE